MTSPIFDFEKVKLASVVAAHVQLLDIYVVDSRGTLEVPRDVAIDSLPATMEVKTGSSHKYDEGAKVLSVRQDFEVRVIPEEGGDGSLMTIGCTLMLEYGLDMEGGPTGEEREGFLAAFAEVNGCYNGWPYLREFVQTTVGRMGMPQLVLDVLRIPRPKREEETEPEGDPSGEKPRRRKAKKATPKTKK